MIIDMSSPINVKVCGMGIEETHVVHQGRNMHVGGSLDARVLVDDEIEQLHGLDHMCVNVLVDTTGVDCVPASIASGPDIDAAILVLAI